MSAAPAWPAALRVFRRAARALTHGGGGFPCRITAYHAHGPEAPQRGRAVCMHTQLVLGHFRHFWHFWQDCGSTGSKHVQEVEPWCGDAVAHSGSACPVDAFALRGHGVVGRSGQGSSAEPPQGMGELQSCKRNSAQTLANTTPTLAQTTQQWRLALPCSLSTCMSVAALASPYSVRFTDRGSVRRRAASTIPPMQARPPSRPRSRSRGAGPRLLGSMHGECCGRSGNHPVNTKTCCPTDSGVGAAGSVSHVWHGCFVSHGRQTLKWHRSPVTVTALI